MGITRSGLPLSLLLPLSALSVPALTLAGCSGVDDQQTIDVFAASSLTDAYSVLEERFEAEHPDVDIRLNLAGSTALQRQILDGAEAHVYAPADEDLIDGVSDLVVGDTPVYATNQLTLVVPSDPDSDSGSDNGNGSGIESPAGLADDAVLVARCAPGVPCGDATDAYLDATGLELATATEEVNVRSVLLKVATGEVDAGFVYTTDALARSDEVRVIPLSDAPRVELAIARLSNDPAAAEFASYVTSPDGAEVLRSFGFETP